MSIKNIFFCRKSNPTNGASVETWFIDKLLGYFGYLPEDIKLKTSLKEFKVGKGSISEYYKPDYGSNQQSSRFCNRRKKYFNRVDYESLSTFLYKGTRKHES